MNRAKMPKYLIVLAVFFLLDCECLPLEVGITVLCRLLLPAQGCPDLCRVLVRGQQQVVQRTTKAVRRQMPAGPVDLGRFQGLVEPFLPPGIT